MLKRRSKRFALLLVLTMLATMFVGVGTASASMDSLSTPSVADDKVATLGTVVITLKEGALNNGDTVTYSLPSGFEFRESLSSTSAIMDTTDWSIWDGTGAAPTIPNYVKVPNTYSGNSNIITTASLALDQLDDNEIQISYNDANNVSGDNIYILLYLGAVYVESGYDEDIDLVASGPSNGFTKGSLIVGSCTSGEVKIAVTNDVTFSDSFPESSTDDTYVTLRIEENVAGDLEKDDESLKFKLPDGLEWGQIGTCKALWGKAHDGAAIVVTKSANDVGDSTKDIVVYKENDQNDDYLYVAVNEETSEAAGLEINVGIDVEDESDVDEGDVIVTIGGSSDSTTSEAIVGIYGTYGADIAVDGDVPTIIAGQFEQEIPDILITESVEDSIVDGRSITLTLPSTAVWTDVGNGDSDSGLAVGNSSNLRSFVGSDGSELKLIFDTNNGSTDAAELTLEDMEIAVQPGTTGDITVEVGGTAGITGTLTVAKAVTPVTIAAATTPDIKIGSASDGGDLTITENFAGAIQEGDLILDLPEGVSFTVTPKVEVTSGNLDVDTDNITRHTDGTEYNRVWIPIDSESTTASTIKVSGIKYTADRTVPEGDIVVKVKGDAVVETNDPAEINDYFGAGNNYGTYALVSGETKLKLDYDETNNLFSASTTAASTVAAKISTPAPNEVSANASFVIGSTSFKLNGVDTTMDVAPYIKDSRTYMPIRYVGNALGISDSNIIWDGVNQTVTLMKGDKVVQVKIGSNSMLVNGAPVAMDVAPEISNSRTMLPISFIANAFGATASWDAATQTVTIK